MTARWPPRATPRARSRRHFNGATVPISPMCRVGAIGPIGVIGCIGAIGLAVELMLVGLGVICPTGMYH